MRFRVASLLIAIAVAAGLSLAQNDDPRGDLYSAKAIQALEQCFNSSGAFICAPVGGGAAVGGSGTADTVPKWTGASTLGNSNITDDGTVVDINGTVVSATPTNLFFVQPADNSTNFQVNPAPTAGSGGTVLQGAAILNAMNGSDTVDGFLISITNANHTGAGNNLNGLRIDSDATDPDATETAVRVGGGFDNGILFVNGLLQPQTNIRSSSGPLTFTVGTVVPISFSMVTDFAGNDQAHFSLNTGLSILRGVGVGSIVAPSALDGNDVTSFIRYGGFTDPNHTSTGNVTSVVRADTITSPDAQAIHVVINQDAGWNALALVNAGGAWGPADNPPTNKVAWFIDEATNRTGGAGADCVWVARLSNGTEISATVLVTDGACP